MSSLLKGFIRCRELAKAEVKLCDAKIALYNQLNNLDFYDKWIDIYISQAEYAPDKLIAGLEAELKKAELKALKPRIQAVYKAMQSYNNVWRSK